jgi:hypothetical protein
MAAWNLIIQFVSFPGCCYRHTTSPGNPIWSSIVVRSGKGMALRYWYWRPQLRRALLAVVQSVRTKWGKGERVALAGDTNRAYYFKSPPVTFWGWKLGVQTLAAEVGSKASSVYVYVSTFSFHPVIQNTILSINYYYSFNKIPCGTLSALSLLLSFNLPSLRLTIVACVVKSVSRIPLSLLKATVKVCVNVDSIVSVGRFCLQVWSIHNANVFFTIALTENWLFNVSTHEDENILGYSFV